MSTFKAGLIRYGLFLFLVIFSRYSWANDPTSINVILKEGSRLQQQGLYLDARNSYYKAYELSEAATNQGQLVLSKTALAYSEFLLNNTDLAGKLLNQALTEAKENQQQAILPIIHYYLGQVYQAQAKPEQAKAHFEQSLQLSQNGQDPEFLARLYLALAQNSELEEDFFKYQKLSLSSLKQLPQINSGIYLQLAEQALDYTGEKKNMSEHVAYIYELIELAKSGLDSATLRDQAKYYALQGQLYQSQQRNSEALQLTRKAIHLLQEENAEDILMFYEWQAGKILKALGKTELAIKNYRRAVNYVQAIRQDIPVTYQNGKSSFLELFGPLYRGLIELKLDQSAKISDPAEKTQVLRDVQALMERLKQTELEDFFKDRCLLTEVNSENLVIKEEQLAVLYPVVLSDRIELLLSIGSDFYQHTVPVSAERFTQQVRLYSNQARNGLQSRVNRELFDWLIRPVQAQLKQSKIDTLVYIPDGILRLLPLASLHDGEKYLIEHYAISTLPALSVLPEKTETGQNRNINNTQSLLVGLSEPSPASVKELPGKLIKELLGEDITIAENRSIIPTKTLRSFAFKLRDVNPGSESVSRQLKLEEIAEALSLPGVKEELNLLSKTLSSEMILDNKFTLNRFDEMAKLPDYGVIHIASHGFFGGTSDESFIMTYDRLLTIDHMEQLLTSRAAKKPIDLLVLSACQTAEGDDRAPLGLSGVALKARAKSALGSLWPICDEAAVAIMKSFYDGISEQKLSKAKALQQAMIKLIKDPFMNHPFYWSPFVLVGHWN